MNYLITTLFNQGITEEMDAVFGKRYFGLEVPLEEIREAGTLMPNYNLYRKNQIAKKRGRLKIKQFVCRRLFMLRQAANDNRLNISDGLDFIEPPLCRTI